MMLRYDMHWTRSTLRSGLKFICLSRRQSHLGWGAGEEGFHYLLIVLCKQCRMRNEYDLMEGDVYGHPPYLVPFVRSQLRQ